MVNVKPNWHYKLNKCLPTWCVLVIPQNVVKTFVI